MRFNGWQRLWVLISALLFIATGIVLTAAWRTKDTAVVADISSPACTLWLNLPKGFIPTKSPD